MTRADLPSASASATGSTPHPVRAGENYDALACDYDRTLTSGETAAGRDALDALERWRASERHLILVTGRQLPELLHIFPQVVAFDRVIAENGGLLYRPSMAETRLLAPPTSAHFVDALRAHGVDVVFEGRTVVATVRPYDVTAAEVIKELNLDLEIAIKRESVMVLPRGINKGTGLAVALDELELTFERTVGIGDAENDAPFLQRCGLSAAVANAIPALKDRVDLVTTAAYGAGVAELVDELLAEDPEPTSSLSVSAKPPGN